MKVEVEGLQEQIESADAAIQDITKAAAKLEKEKSEVCGSFTEGRVGSYQGRGDIWGHTRETGDHIGSYEGTSTNGYSLTLLFHSAYDTYVGFTRTYLGTGEEGG